MDLMREYHLRTRLGLFLILLPYYCFQDKNIPETNYTIYRKAGKIRELVKCIALWFLVATVATSCDRRSRFDNMIKPSEW